MLRWECDWPCTWHSLPILVPRTDRVAVRELLLAQRQQASSRESVIENAQYDPHCLRFFSGVIAPFVIQSPASTGCGRHTLEFPIASASPHIVRLVTRILGHSITVRPISKLGPSQTEKEILGTCGVDRVHGALEIVHTGALVCDDWRTLLHKDKARCSVHSTHGSEGRYPIWELWSSTLSGNTRIL